MGKILETERLILRTWIYPDAEALFEICRDAEVMFHIGDRKPYETIEKAREFLNWAVSFQKKFGFCRWAVIEKSSEKIIGNCGFAYRKMEDAELGYLFAREFWGKGFATEAARACVEYGFKDLKFEKIVALTDVDHVISQRVLEKIGFVRRAISKTDDDEDMFFEAVNPYKIA
jgi:RimJ/RimL family protein N-acetyltransferase